ncbi:hypothetical protein [Clostridium sp. cel8]|uniref:hypothetical protein n=1 Tax=Clostridium sp. cel8 TaxID=2663123 RepID=UPI001A9BB7DA|nr:hypothetical protein [Clostridium sp. cel8]
MNRRNRVVFIVSFLICIIFFTSCAKSIKKEYSFEDTFDMKLASNIVETYMKYLTKGETESIKKLYSKDLLKSPVNNENSKLRIWGYNVEDKSKIGQSAIFLIDVSRSYIDEPFASLDKYSIKVVKENNEYKISKIDNAVEQEAFVYKNKIRMKSKDSANTSMIISLKSFPNYVFAKNDEANLDKLPVPKYNLGIMNFSYDGSMLGVTTYDKNSYIGVIKIDQSMSVQGNMQDGGQGDSGQDSQDSEGNQDVVEKPIGKEIVTLDFLKDSKVNFMEFSKDEKFLAVQYNNKDIGNCIRVYIIDDGDMIDYEFEEKFPMDKVDIDFSSFDDDVLNFDVVAKKNDDTSVSDIIGKWQLDLIKFKAVRM